MRYEVRTTAVFHHWLRKLRDRRAVLAIANRVDRAAVGNLCDAEPVGKGVSEIRIFVGKGYRVYFCTRGAELIVLLCGGDKSTQQKDIKRAKALAETL